MKRYPKMPTVPVVTDDPGGVKRQMPDEKPELPPVFPPPKPFNSAAAERFQEAKRRNEASPWKKEWHGNGEPVPTDKLPTYAEWKARKGN